MIEVVNTSDWPFEKIAPYGEQITAALKRLVERYPYDMTLESIREELMSGQQALWLALDDGEFVACALTEVRDVPETGRKALLIMGMAGDRGMEMVPFIDRIERWARENGLHEIRPVGRLGWRKALAEEGYEPVAIYYRKELH